MMLKQSEVRSKKKFFILLSFVVASWLGIIILNQLRLLKYDPLWVPYSFRTNIALAIFSIYSGFLGCHFFLRESGSPSQTYFFLLDFAQLFCCVSTLFQIRSLSI